MEKSKEVTPQEKAKELIKIIYPRATSYSLDSKNQFENAKILVLIMIDEILNSIPCYEDYGGDGWKLIDNSEYWIEVKKEIEKLCNVKM